MVSLGWIPHSSGRARKCLGNNSKGLDYFALVGLVDYLRFSYLLLKMDHEKFVLLLASSENA